MDLKKFLISGFLAGIVIFVIWMVFGYLVQMVFPYDVTKLPGMRAETDPVMLLFFLNPWVYGFAMALFYPYFGESIMGDYIVKGRTFGGLVWLVSSIPSAFIVYTSMEYPIGFTINQVIGSLIYMIIAGIIIAKVDEL
jgi:hypothetical protein